VFFRKKANAQNADRQAIENAVAQFNNTGDLYAAASDFKVDPMTLERRVNSLSMERVLAKDEKLNRPGSGDWGTKKR